MNLSLVFKASAAVLFLNGLMALFMTDQFMSMADFDVTADMHTLGLLAGEVMYEGGLVEIMSIGIFLCQTIIAYPVVPADVDFNHPAIKTMGLRITSTLFIINATAVWMILAMPEFPQIAALFHGILALIMGMRLVMIATGQNPPVHK